jgi:hypothetical protein
MIEALAAEITAIFPLAHALLNSLAESRDNARMRRE